MNRKEFLQKTALTGMGLSLLSTTNAEAKVKKPILPLPETCVLIPAETAGPFPLDLTDNTYFFRQDIREDRAGVPYHIRLKVLGVDNCLPMQNVRVHIWHCDKDGNYSGYNSEAGLTYCRGYQITDANGEVSFITVFPGWYNGRVWHIHFQVYVSSMYAATSQFTVNHDTVNEIYNNNAALYTKGEDPLSPETDFLLADSYLHQMGSLAFDEELGMYSTYFEAAVQGEGMLGVGHTELQTAAVCALGQNAPNPYTNDTVVPYTIKQPATVSIALWNMQGQQIATLINQQYHPAGKYEIAVNPLQLGLSLGNYVYQLTVVNSQGTFTIPKLMSYMGKL